MDTPHTIAPISSRRPTGSESIEPLNGYMPSSSPANPPRAVQQQHAPRPTSNPEYPSHIEPIGQAHRDPEDQMRRPEGTALGMLKFMASPALKAGSFIQKIHQ